MFYMSGQQSPLVIETLIYKKTIFLFTICKFTASLLFDCHIVSTNYVITIQKSCIGHSIKRCASVGYNVLFILSEVAVVQCLWTEWHGIQETLTFIDPNTGLKSDLRFQRFSERQRLPSKCFWREYQWNRLQLNSIRHNKTNEWFCPWVTWSYQVICLIEVILSFGLNRKEIYYVLL